MSAESVVMKTAFLGRTDTISWMISITSAYFVDCTFYILLGAVFLCSEYDKRERQNKRWQII